MKTLEICWLLVWLEKILRTLLENVSFLYQLYVEDVGRPIIDDECHVQDIKGIVNFNIMGKL